MFNKPSNKDWDKVLDRIRKESKESKFIDSCIVEFDFENLSSLSDDFPGIVKFNSVPASALMRAIIKEKTIENRRLDIRFKNGTFDGTLHLEHLHFPGYLRFQKCEFKGRLDFRHTNLRRLKFVNCQFEKILEADVARIEGDIEVTGCDLYGGLVLRAAYVGGRIVVDGSIIGEILNDDRKDTTAGFAIDASMVNAKSGVSLRKLNDRPMTLNGGFDLTSAVIGGNLEFRGVTISPCVDATAVDLTNGKVNGFFFIRENSELNGKLNIFGTELRLFSISDNSMIKRGRDCNEPAIDGEEVNISTSFTLGEGVSVEGINLSAANIKGVFQFGGRADESGVSHSSEVGKGINVHGRLNLTHARIGRLSIDFPAWSRCCNKSEMEPLFNGCVYDDIVNINGRDIVHKNKLEKWIKTIKDADVYFSEYTPTESSFNRVEKLFCLNTSSNYHPQVYFQLISVLRSKGREGDSYSIERLNYISSIFSKYNNRFVGLMPFLLLYLLRDWLVGYGRSINRLLASAAIFVISVSYLYMASYENGRFFPSNPIIFQEFDAPEGDVTPLKTDVFYLVKPFYFHNYLEVNSGDVEIRGEYPRVEYPSFNPVLYSLDVFLPLVDLSQEKNWSPVTDPGYFSWIWLLVVLQVILGWIFSGLAIAYASGIVRMKS